MKSLYQILTDAQNLIRDPAKWTQGAYARDAHGETCPTSSPNAVCWCGAGAVIKSGGSDFALRKRLAEVLMGIGIVHANDDIGHAKVMELLDKARERARTMEAA